MGPGTHSPAVAMLMVVLLASLALAAIGMILHGRGLLSKPVVAFVYSLLIIAPVYAFALSIFTKHTVERMTGETKSATQTES